MSNYEMMMIHQRGWRHGASAKAMDPTLTEHSDAGVRQAHSDGYTLGRGAQRTANEYAAAKFGVKLNEIKAAILRT